MVVEIVVDGHGQVRSTPDAEAAVAGSGDHGFDLRDPPVVMNPRSWSDPILSWNLDVASVVHGSCLYVSSVMSLKVSATMRPISRVCPHISSLRVRKNPAH